MLNYMLLSMKAWKNRASKQEIKIMYYTTIDISCNILMVLYKLYSVVNL